MCSDDSGLIAELLSGLVGNGVIVAHELGHVFGMAHDSTGKAVFRMQC
jgi:predicted Zn-dependent protease with MMP-like domain